LFVDDHVDDTVSLMNLKRIVEELQEEKGIQQVNNLLLLKGASNARLNFQEFVDYMRKTYTDDEIQSKVQKVKEMKNEESANSGNNENRSFRKRK
jgi:hypothetical protein